MSCHKCLQTTVTLQHNISYPDIELPTIDPESMVHEPFYDIIASMPKLSIVNSLLQTGSR